MPTINLSRVADMPMNVAGQSIISGSKWDADAAALEGAINGGLDTSNLSASAAIKGTQLADATIPRSKAATDFERNSRLYWINL